MPLSPVRTHPWDLAPRAAMAFQSEMAGQVIETDDPRPLRTVAGIDIGFEAGGRITRAAIAVLRLPDLELVETALARRPTAYPYVPGLLSFREIPAALEAFATLRASPDLLVCDGQGRAHPRRFGLASHLGWVLDHPSIGIAKSRLVGSAETPGQQRGSQCLLYHQDEMIGAVVRTRTGAAPVYVSVGHRISLERAVAVALELTPRFRLPETTRAAHRLASPVRGPRVRDLS